MIGETEMITEEEEMKSISEIMTSEVSTVDPGMTLREALEALRGWNVGGAPVVQGSEVVGVLSMTDLLEFEATTSPVPAFRGDQAEFGDWGEPEPWEEGEEPPLYFVDFWTDVEADVGARMESVEGPEWDYLRDHTVAEAMSRKILAVPAAADVRRAARLMADAAVNRLLVVEKGELAGVVSASDIVRAVADELI